MEWMTVGSCEDGPLAYETDAGKPQPHSRWLLGRGYVLRDALRRACFRNVVAEVTTMPDALSRAKQFNRLAKENLQLAECASTLAGSRHHRIIAEHYLLMAAAELHTASERLKGVAGSGAGPSLQG
jgi:hypothetical protein